MRPLLEREVGPIRDALIDAYVYRQFLDHVIGTLGSLSAEYQPVTSLESGQVEHHEALLRITSPTYGSIYPASFLLLMDQLGVMREITRWMVDRVLADLAVADAKVFVNLPAVLIGDATFVEYANRARGRSGVGPGRLGFEVPFDAAVGNGAEAWLTSVHEAGFPVAIDRCGHADLAGPQLAEMPAEYVKLVLCPGAAILQDETEDLAAIVARLGRAGKRVVALGIEDRQALVAVRRAGFHCGQGFYIGRPAARLALSVNVADS